MHRARPHPDLCINAQADATNGILTRVSSRPDGPRFLQLADVADVLNTSAAQVYALVRSGDLPAIKIGGRGVWRVDRDKLDTYLDDLEKQTASWAKSNPLHAKEKPPPDE